MSALSNPAAYLPFVIAPSILLYFIAKTDEFVYKVQNLYSNDGHQIYFFLDPPHLLKTMRNMWSSDKRNLWVSAYMHA